MLVTALTPKIGYDNAAKIAKRALKNKTTLKYETLKSGLINEKEYNKIINPKNDLSIIIVYKNISYKVFKINPIVIFFWIVI